MQETKGSSKSSSSEIFPFFFRGTHFFLHRVEDNRTKHSFHIHLCMYKNKYV